MTGKDPDLIRQSIRTELEDTRVAFHTLLAGVPDDAWEKPNGNPAWNNRQMFYHKSVTKRMNPC